MKAPPAESQCTVTNGDRIELYGSAGKKVRMAWDRVADKPAVIWVDADTSAIYYSKFRGPNDDDWDTPELVDAGTVFLPIVDFDLRGYRMLALAFDGASMPHVVMAARASETASDIELFYTHLIGEAGWSEPVQIADLPDIHSPGEVFLEADFDSSGCLHVLYSIYVLEERTNALYRTDGIWHGPDSVLPGSTSLDMAIDSEERIHIVTMLRRGGSYQVVYKRSMPGGVTWPSGDGTTITEEPPINCGAGPVSCWPSIAVDIDGRPHVAYGVDPDPCCDAALDDPSIDCSVDPYRHDYDLVVNDGYISVSYTHLTLPTILRV